MTFATSHVLMLPVQLKPGIIMIKFLRFPVIKSVTSFTIVYTLDFKLFKVNIGMTDFTISTQIFKLLDFVSASFPEMTTFARCVCMFPQKFKTGQVVIK